MNSSEKITFIGNTVLHDDKFVNFYPQYKKINDKIIPLDDADRASWFRSYPNINIGSREPEDSPEMHRKYGVKLKEYAKHICMVTISKEDILITKQDKLRLPFCDLMERGDIKRLSLDDSDFYKITTTDAYVDWTKDEVRIIPLNEELLAERNYFLECHDGFFRGPFEYRELSGVNGMYSKGLLAPKNKIPQILTDFYEISIDGYKTERVVYFPNDSVNDEGKNENKRTPLIKPIESDNNNTDGREKIKARRDELFEEIKQYRKYSKNEIYNILICITQGFLTVFAGEPGTGKTSICDTVAKVLGLSSKEEDKNRYLSISVERGWTSKNDLIGYYNPLTEKFTDSTGLYTALKQLGEENANNECINPYFVLLDEANLSQMEHYWASFIKLADANARKDTKLILAPAEAKDSQKEKIVTEIFVPDTLKFLATINNDHTTESLSPRLLDRAWIITLPAPKEDNFVRKNVETAYADGITWESMTYLFGADSVETTSHFELAKTELNTIYKLYSDHKRIVSPRSKMAIDDYLKVALDCFDGADVVASAIDFVIMQKLLPMLNGYISEDFAKKLQELFKKYPMSYAKFEDMRSQNDNLDNTYVSFFM